MNGLEVDVYARPAPLERLAAPLDKGSRFDPPVTRGALGSTRPAAATEALFAASRRCSHQTMMGLAIATEE